MNDDTTKPAAQDPLWDEAWAWLMRQHEQGAHDGDTAAGLARWLAASPDHRKVSEQASRLWLLSGFVPPVHDVETPRED